MLGKRFRSSLWIAVVCLFAFSQTAICDPPPDGSQFVYRAFVLGVRKGRPATSFSIRSLSSTNQFTLLHGTISFAGSIFPPPPQAISLFPNTMRFTLIHLSEKGTVISRNDFDLKVDSFGRIHHQYLLLKQDIAIRLKERLNALFTPVDSALPACLFNFTVRFIPANSLSSSIMDSAPPFPRPGTFDASLSISRAIGVLAKGQETFPFELGRPAGRGIPWKRGTFSVAGKIIPITAGVPVPNLVNMIIKHFDSSGKIVSTDTDEIKILPTGVIPEQKFPLSAIGPDHKFEKLKFSFVPLDAPIPAGLLKIKLSYSRG